MLRLRKPLVLLPTIALLAPATASAELFISEYVEGSSSNKAIEIYNPLGVSVNLADYELRLYSNGAALPSQMLALAGTLAAGDVYVLVHPSSAPALLALGDQLNSTVINFNGDDAVELYKVSTTSTVDALGQFGFDPGVAWSNGGVTTVNATLRRNADVCQGDANGTDAFDPSIEWTGFLSDTFDGLGAHTSACAPAVSAFCDASDGALASCPCANPGTPDTGCDNAQATGGVSLLVLAQATSPNGATLTGTGFSTMGAPTALVIRSNALDPASPVVFGDGLRCINTSPLVRLAATTASGGVSTHVFGHGAGAGPGTFYYQLWYRNIPSGYCTPAAYNLSSGRTLAW